MHWKIKVCSWRDVHVTNNLYLVVEVVETDYENLLIHLMM
jgi:hypothetical protein